MPCYYDAAKWTGRTANVRWYFDNRLARRKDRGLTLVYLRRPVHSQPWERSQVFGLGIGIDIFSGANCFTWYWGYREWRTFGRRRGQWVNLRPFALASEPWTLRKECRAMCNDIVRAVLNPT